MRDVLSPPPPMSAREARSSRRDGFHVPAAEARSNEMAVTWTLPSSRSSTARAGPEANRGRGGGGVGERNTAASVERTDVAVAGGDAGATGIMMDAMARETTTGGARHPSESRVQGGGTSGGDDGRGIVERGDDERTGDVRRRGERARAPARQKKRRTLVARVKVRHETRRRRDGREDAGGWSVVSAIVSILACVITFAKTVAAATRFQTGNSARTPGGAVSTLSVVDGQKKSAKTSEMMAMSFMRMLSAGPEVSLGVSDVSPRRQPCASPPAWRRRHHERAVHVADDLARDLLPLGHVDVETTLLDVLLGVIPRAAGVARGDGQLDAGDESAGE